jgi:hypothetical protein
MFLRRIRITFLYKTILTFAIFSFLLCLFQVENFTNSYFDSSRISINSAGVTDQDSHTPQVCNLVSQKYSNQNNGLLNFLISKKQDVVYLYNNLDITFNVFYSQINIDDKIYIKNVTLLV